MHGEIAGRAEQQHVIVVGGQERLDRDDAVAAGAVPRPRRPGPISATAYRRTAALADIGAGARPNGTMNFTGRVGQLCACAGACETNSAAATRSAASTDLVKDPFVDSVRHGVSPLAFAN